MKKIKTYEIKIALGLKEGYEGKQHSIADVKKVVQLFCNKIKIGVTITPTTFVYVDGQEEGVILGLINYPRFPKDEKYILQQAYNLTLFCMKKFKQIRASIITPDETIMLEENDAGIK